MPKRNKTRRKPKKALDNIQGGKTARGRKAGRNQQVLEPLTSRTATKDAQWPAGALEGLLPGPSEPDRPKKGRPTIPDHFLLGSRNAWLRFLEECWPEIGWPLLEIRKREGSTIEVVQRAFSTVAGKEGCFLARVFLQGSPRPVVATELRANRIRGSRLHYKIQEMHSRRRDLEFACTEAENARREANAQNKELIEKEAERRRARLREHDENLRRTESRSKELDRKIQDQETHWYCSQLLDFLRQGRYAVAPLNMANALAGLPQMGWRESLARCSKMPRDQYEAFPYRVFRVVSHIWRRRPKDLQNAPTEFFKVQILKLPQKGDSMRDHLGRGWRDFRSAIEECWEAREAQDFMPYAITAAFIRKHARQKTAEERIVHENEMLV